MKKNKKVFLTILFLMVMLMAMLTCNNSYAVLQVNGGEPTTQTLANWMTNFRKMEGLGGTLGLEETLNTNLTGTTSNNLDCHMIKNTEYGALTILSASSYGNPYRIEDGDTTTGNKTGAYMKINGERVAAACSDLDPSTWKNANPRYKNIYTTSYQRKIGDSVDIGSWHGGNNLSWFYVDYYGGMDHYATPRRATLVRSYSGSIFSYTGSTGRTHSGGDYGIAFYNNLFYSRPVIVVGEGF